MDNRDLLTDYLENSSLTHIKSIKLKNIIDKIRHFRKLNFQNMSDMDLGNAIMDVLCENGRFDYLCQTSKYPQGTPFFRVRRLSSSIISEMNFKNYNDFWEPPASVIKKPGRLNKIGESLLYTVPVLAEVAIQETHINNGDFFALIKYIALKDINVNVIGGDINYSVRGITDENIILVNNLHTDFLRDEFSRDVGEGTEYLYRISERIAKDYFDLPESVQDAWAYSSVKDKTKYNVCFRPKKAHELLELQGAVLCKLEDGNISPLCIATCKPEEQIMFSQIGSELQKKLFPEIISKHN